MSKQQREHVDAMMRRPRPEGAESIEAFRERFKATMARMIVPDGIGTAQARLGARPALRVEPAGGARVGTILYLHGGGWVVGSPETSLSLTGNLVVRTGFEAYSLDYRLAPEHPFPAAIEDAVSAYRALLERGQDPSTIAFAGDSAGGGLSVSTCLVARDAGLPLPAAIVTFSGAFDATGSGESMDSKEGLDPIFTRESLEPVAAMYLAGDDPHQPMVSPAVVGDLTGLPPLLIQAGTNEVLLDDSTRLAARARAAGVSVVLDTTAEVPHVFQSFAGVLDEADQALERAALFLTQHVRACDPVAAGAR
jgi:monoterpene epsilon-lactone hydrolase